MSERDSRNIYTEGAPLLPRESFPAWQDRMLRLIVLWAAFIIAWAIGYAMGTCR